jgi:hypothetical protein
MIERQIFTQAAGPRECRTREAMKAFGLPNNTIILLRRPNACLLLNNLLALQDDRTGRKPACLLLSAEPEIERDAAPVLTGLRG